MSRQGIYEIVMSPTHLDMASTASALLITRPVPFLVRRWGLIVTVEITTGASLIVDGNHETSAGSDTDPTGVEQYGTITGQAATITVDTCYYQNTSGDGATNLVLPGERAEFIVTSAAGGGDAFIWAQIMNYPFVAQPTRRLTTDPGYTTNGATMGDNWLSAFTEVTS